MQSIDFPAAVTRFAELAVKAAELYGVEVRAILQGNLTKNQTVCAARMDILHAMQMEFDLSTPELAILFRLSHHTSIVLMQKRMNYSTDWKLKKELTTNVIPSCAAC